ncbi:MAG: MFS transporter [Candidatus Odinarchaeota archaeon]|nr:MFS transporter [Candidatus Odinarchaeota archaeon]
MKATSKGQSYLKLLVIVYAGNFIAPFGAGLFTSIIPAVEKTFSASVEYIALATAIYMFSFGASQAVSGTASDIVGRKPFLLLGFFLFGFGGLLAAAIPDANIFLISRVFQGVGDGIMNPIFLLLFGDNIKEDVRPKAISILVSSVMAGLTFGSYIGGCLGIDWQLAFWAMGIYSLVLFVFAFPFIKNKLPTVTHQQVSVITNIKLVFKSKVAIVVTVVGFALYFTRVGAFTLLSDALGTPKIHLSYYDIGLVFTVAGIASIISGPVAGILDTKIGCIKTTILGLVGLSAAYFSFLHQSFLEYLFLIMFLIGFSHSLIAASLNTMIVKSVKQASGTATSLFFTFMGFAMGVGPVLLLPVYLDFFVQGIGVACALINFSMIALIWKIRTIEQNNR